MTERAEDLLTVVIPTWNGRELLRNCLQSLRAQTARPAILVVDDGSSDSTAAMIREAYPEVRLLQLELRVGFASAVNRGIQACSTPFVALLNNDTETDSNWVAAGLRAMQNEPGYSFFASRMIQYSNREFLDSAGDCYSRSGLPFKRGFGDPVDRYPNPEPVLGASAGAAFYRLSLFQRVGFFDEDFYMYLEDVELSLRAQSAGFRCLYLPDAVVYHWEAGSDPQRLLTGEKLNRLPAFGARGPELPRSGFYSDDRVYWITRNRWLLMVLYQPLRNLPWLTWGWTKSTLFHALKAGFLGAFVRGILAGLRMTPATLSKRLRLRTGRIITRRELCEALRKC